MPLSSYSIFHYTSKFETITSILWEQELRPSYCHEINGLSSSQHVWIPMVSFCDVPLSQSQKIQSYGKYAIGFNKDWALTQSINPVFYFNKESIVYKRYSRLKETFRREVSLGDESSVKLFDNPGYSYILRHLFPELGFPEFHILGEPSKEALMNSTLNFYQNYKQFEGRLERGGGIVTENYKFYDERELRYIPDICKDDFENFPPLIFEKDWGTKYKDKLGSKPHFEKGSKYNLSFTLESIEHLIVEEDSEIPALITFLKTLPDVDEMVLHLLISKITSFERIKRDY